MIVENMTDGFFPPEISAAFARKVGARVSGGTDMKILSKALTKSFKLEVYENNDIFDLINSLKMGYMAVVNASGNRTGYTGLFSDSGHYVVAACFDNDKQKIGVLDPGYYTGKFNKTGRKGKVEIIGNICYVSPDNLDKDATGKNPKYYIFKKAEG